MAHLTDQNQVYLGGMLFELTRPIRSTIATPFPPKMSVGDHTRDDFLFTSSWVLNNFHGGLGIHRASMPRDQDRFSMSTLGTMHQKQITLAPEVVHASPGGPSDILIDYSELLFRNVGTDVRRWNEPTKDETSIHTLNSIPTDAVVFDGELVIVTPTSFEHYNGNTDTWTVDTSVGGQALVVWDNKLFRLDMDNELYWIDLLGEPWEFSGKILLPPGYVRQLLTYFDLTGEIVIYAVTKVGVLAHEFGTSRFFPTPVTFPVHPSAGGGAAVWQSDLHIPVGSSVYRYTGSTFLNVGPDKDEGLPPDFAGEVIQVVPAHGMFYAVVQSRQLSEEDEEEDPLQSGQPQNTTFFGQVETQGAILVSPGIAWHVVHLEEAAGGQMGKAHVASIEDTYRLWFTSGVGLFHVDIPTTLHNPLFNPATRFAPEGFLLTPEFDAQWADIDKLALVVRSTARRITETERVRLWVSYDGAPDFELIGEITHSGDTDFALHGPPGRLFRTAQIRIDLYRGDDATKTPVLERVVFGFIRRPDLIWAWDMEISIVDERHGMSASQHWEFLQGLVESKLAVEFEYRPFEDDHHDRVIVTRAERVETTGTDHRGRFRVSLVKPEAARREHQTTAN